MFLRLLPVRDVPGNHGNALPFFTTRVFDWRDAESYVNATTRFRDADRFMLDDLFFDNVGGMPTTSLATSLPKQRQNCACPRAPTTPTNTPTVVGRVWRSLVGRGTSIKIQI